METETIKKLISSFGHIDFKKIVYLVVRNHLKYNVINTDGSWDSGSDWSIYTNGDRNNCIVIQDTVTSSSVEVKANRDAEKTKQLGQINKYVFFTSQRLSASRRSSIESVIEKKFGFSTTCYDANLLGEIIEEGGLLGLFNQIIDKSIPIQLPKPKSIEMLLNGMKVYSDDSHKYRRQFIEDAIAIEIATNSNQAKDDIVSNVCRFLSLPSTQEKECFSVFDSMMSKGSIIKGGSDFYSISDDLTEQHKLNRFEYSEQLLNVIELINNTLNKLSIDTALIDANVLIALYSRLFIAEQKGAICKIDSRIAFGDLIEYLGNPDQEIRDYLQKCGVQPNKITKIKHDVGIALSSCPLIKKLAQTSVFYLLNGKDPLSVCLNIGASRWRDVTVYIDTCVAIPYICTRLFGDEDYSYGDVSKHLIDSLCKTGATVKISYYYVNELSAHFVRAKKYISLAKYENELIHSENFFVSHFYRMKSVKADMPKSFEEYLNIYSQSRLIDGLSDAENAKKVFSDFDKILNSKDVKTFQFPEFEVEFYKEIEEDIAYLLRDKGKEKVPFLFNNDKFMLALMKKEAIENHPSIFVTWDGIILEVSMNKPTQGVCTTPDYLSDLLTPYQKIDNVKLVSIAHKMAMHVDIEKKIGSLFLDKLIECASADMPEWKMDKMLEEFKRKMIQSIDLNNERVVDIVQREAIAFIKAELQQNENVV